MRRDVFQAIADPTRRAIIQMVSMQSLTLNSVAERFEMSRQAVTKHIRILTECGLITIQQRGRERYCEPRLERLSEVSDWIGQYERFWNTRLDALDDYLQRLQKERKKRPNN